jgi:hypothetical protein
MVFNHTVNEMDGFSPGYYILQSQWGAFQYNIQNFRTCIPIRNLSG